MTIPLRIPQHSTRFMYPAKSTNSSMVGLNTGIPLEAEISSSGSNHVLPSLRGEIGAFSDP